MNIKLNEITTYFRVYSVELLKQLPYDELNAQGYSLGVKLVWLMKKLNANLVETPIHFRDRNKGQRQPRHKSKGEVVVRVFSDGCESCKCFFANYWYQHILSIQQI